MSFKKTLSNIKWAELSFTILIVVFFIAASICIFCLITEIGRFLENGGIRSSIIDAGREVKSIMTEINQ